MRTLQRKSTRDDNPARPAPRLNRALFADRPLDSGALTALVTLLHQFTKPGEYELIARRDGQVVNRSRIRAVGEMPGAAPAGDRGERPGQAAYQINVDLATLGQTLDPCATEGYEIATGGVMGFFVGQGAGRYSVLLTRVTDEAKETVLDSEKGVPAGDFFAVTLVRPGVYLVANRLGEGQMKVEVKLPSEKGYRPNEGTLVQVTRGGFDPASASLLAGQSLLFQCQTAAQFVIELAEPAPETTRAAGERRRHTVRKRRPASP
jgi:hypothetical protein